MKASRIGLLMVIDDDSTDQFLYRRVINRSGLVSDLITFQYAEDALEYLRHGAFPDLILLDINMPRMNGFEFLETALSEFGDRFSVVVFMLTTSINSLDQQKAAEFTVVKDYIKKPLSESVLQRAADVVCEHQRQD